MDAADAVHELRDAQVDDGARERERLAALESVLAPHQLQHVVDGERGRLVEILVEAEREPRLGRPRVGLRELGLVVQRRASARTRSAGHSIASCETSPSPCRAWQSPAEKSAPSTGIGRNSVVPATSSLQSMFPPEIRGGAVGCRPVLGRRHAHHAEERPQVELATLSVAAGSRVGVELVDERAADSPSESPSRSLSGVEKPPPTVNP